MGRIRSWLIAIAGAAVLAACAPAAGRESGIPGGAASQEQTRALTVIMRIEPTEIFDAAANRGIFNKVLFTANLGDWDLQGVPYPVLASTLPQLNTDSWKVFPDGRMETIHRLRPGLTWHDGIPLSSQDLVFRYQVHLKRVEWTGVQGTGATREIAQILAPDPHTVAITWKTPFFEAAAPDLPPYPRHLLEGLLGQNSLEAWDNDPYWATGYIGVGPYRLERWERGAFMQGIAFEGYALGRPKIHRINLTWSNDPNAGLTRLLSGAADMSLDNGILFPQAAILKQHWTSESIGTIILNPSSLRYIQVQFRPDYVSPRTLLDPRIRQAILYGIDRPAVAETVLEDSSMVAHTVVPPTVPYYPEVDRAVRKYPFDPRRADQLMAEVGFGRGADGVFASPSEGRFRIEVRGSTTSQEELDTTLVASYLQKAGMEANILLLDQRSRAVDDEMKGTFPGLTLNNNTLQRGLGLNKFISTNIGAPENRWSGGNRMGYASPAFDRAHEAYRTTLDPREQVRPLIDMMRILSEDLPGIPLYYDFQVVAHTAAIRGPEPITPDNTQYGNVHLWEWR